ncbi:hypothetical protein QNH39_00420 [Neobacillus novalis]|uniref:Uncharacterized protein n=1 Tax=Neobacillus novalis TaxID=220687 RepID=A0AA95MTZ6_9BACI|nr:hypothetical protein [Neobacillus novalis]WHY86418.1 hypothetical protein QNH39_00420 [Neobacillus novalis]
MNFLIFEKEKSTEIFNWFMLPVAKPVNAIENASQFVLPFGSVFAFKNKMAQFTILSHF